MQIISVIVIIAGFIMLARSALFWLYWIQMKQNRLDRIWLAIKSRNFCLLFFSKHRIMVLAFFLSLPLLLMGLFRTETHYRLWYSANRVAGYLLLVYILLYALSTILSSLRRRLGVPRITHKFGILLGVILILEMIVVYHFELYVLLAIEIFQPFIILGVFSLVYTPNVFFRRYFINRARKKITAHKNLVVIGITGSYGKTSTKEFLAHILAKKFNVLKTPAHINVDTGVARVILRDLKPEHEVFIVEMGAYKEREIAAICNLVHPQYAILTGLSDQHLELFGSIKAIAQAKFELIAAVSEPGHIVANGDCKPLIIEFERRSIKPVWYGQSSRAWLKPQSLNFAVPGMKFQLGEVIVEAPIFGSAAMNNLLGAITMAQLLGMNLQEIASATREVSMPPHTLNLKTHPSGALILDDTYNANTEGVIAALNDLALASRAKRIFVFSEVIELGERAKEDHVRIAKAAAQSTDYVLLLPSRMRRLMCDTLIQQQYAGSHILGAKDIEKIRQITDKDTVILLEGRGSDKFI